MKLLVIDADYLSNRAGEPVVRLYGKKVDTHDEGKDVILHAKGFEPYFYANVEWSAKEDIENVLKTYIKRIELVKRYQPIGYQTEKSEMIKIVLFNPKSTPECRKIIEAMDIQVMEADVLFKNRFLIDTGISGMSVVEFDHIGKELNHYSNLNCKELYIIDYKGIRVTDVKVNIEY